MPEGQNHRACPRKAEPISDWPGRLFELREGQEKHCVILY